MKIKNLNGTQSEYYRDIGLANWMRYKGVVTTSKCSVLGCGRDATDGAHVKKVGSLDQRWYICPTCHAHNTSGAEFELKPDWATRLVALRDL